MQRYLILLILLLATNSFSQALITRLYILCNKEGDCIYLLGDAHIDAGEADKKQLNIMTKILEKREQVSQEPLDILIEQDSPLDKKLCSDPSVMSQLDKISLPLPFITFHDIDLRMIGKLAHYIFEPLLDPKCINSGWNFWFDLRLIEPNKLTFNDVLNEFNTSFNNFKLEQAGNPFVLQDIFDSFTKQARCQHNKLLKKLEQLEISTSAIMLEVSKKLFEEEESLLPEKTTRNKLRRRIVYMNSNLLDLNVLYTLANLSSKKKVVITGYHHTMELKASLEAAGYYTRNTFDYKNDFQPLLKKELKTIITLPFFPDFVSLPKFISSYCSFKALTRAS